MNKMVIAFLLVGALVSCKDGSKGTTTGNPFIRLVATSSSSAANVAQGFWRQLIGQLLNEANAYPPPNSMQDAAGNTVSLSDLWWTIDEIEFKFYEVPDGSEVDKDSVEIRGPFTIDLLDSSPDSFAQGNISLTQIRRMKVQLKRTSTLPTGAPSALSGNSLYLAGQVNGFTFDFSSDEETTFVVSGSQAVNVNDGSRLLWELKTANLIKKINFSSISSNVHISNSNKVNASNPCPSIDSSATDLYTCFKKGLQTESNLGRDDDNDNLLDPEEESVD